MDVDRIVAGLSGESQALTLRFVNSDARPKTTEVQCSPASVAPIMAWYGAYHAGDRYYVTVNGARVEKDRNGELTEHSLAVRARLQEGQEQ